MSLSRLLAPSLILATVLSRSLGAQPVPLVSLAPRTASAVFEFSTMTHLRELRDGSVIVAGRGSNPLVHVQWDSRDRTIWREGAGPGEYRVIGGLFGVRGDTSVLTDTWLGRWSLLAGTRFLRVLSEDERAPDLQRATVLGMDTLDGVLLMRPILEAADGPGGAAAAERLALLYWRPGRAADTVALVPGPGRSGMSVVPASGGQPARVFTTNPLTAHDQGLLFPDGWIAVARVDPYRVDLRRPDGRWVRGEPLPHERVAVGEREKCAALRRSGIGGDCIADRIRGWPAAVPAFVTTAYQGWAPVLVALPDGRLAVARSRRAEDERQRYDIVDRQGRLTSHLVLPPGHAIVGVGRSDVYVAERTADGVQRLHRHPWRAVGP